MEDRPGGSSILPWPATWLRPPRTIVNAINTHKETAGNLFAILFSTINDFVGQIEMELLEFNLYKLKRELAKG